MIKYQLRLTTRKRGTWEHRYSKLYDSVADMFANPEFAKYIQENHIGAYHTMCVLTVNVPDADV